jgi:hypothetical protein
MNRCAFRLLGWLLLAGCGSGGADDGDNGGGGGNSGGEQTPAHTDGYTFEYKGATVYMDEDIAAVFEKIGEPRSTFEAPSCAFDGIDRIFGYPGADIHTYPANGRDLVYTVNFKDDSIATPEGVYLGGSLADVLDAYGEGYEQELGMYTYTKGRTYISFLVEDGEVILITIGLTM